MTVRTVESLSKALASTFPDHRTFTFLKENKYWYVDLPGYLSQGGAKEDLQLKTGTDKLLTRFARGKNKVTLTIDTEPFEGADVLELTQLCNDKRGGAVYLMESSNGQHRSSLFWICDIALFVFGDLPEKIYIRERNPLAEN
jgi:hypothetical protein